MGHDGVEIPEDLEIRVWDADIGYRTCTVCGGDCEPEQSGAEGHGIRIMFACPQHGVNSVVDPFEDKR
ncbi:hypothetical protein [Leucobacter sp. MMO-66]|uniref:hypothetical protein n=1 Tax=Leucobacter sp. MMO-66 TaxID=3081265 RepID=UPI003018F246